MAKALGSAQTPSNIQTETKKEWDKGILALMEQAEKNKNAPATTATNIPTAQKTEESYAQKQQQLLSAQYAAQERKRIAALKADMKENIVTGIMNLLKVKSIVTVLLSSVFSVLALRGGITGDLS